MLKYLVVLMVTGLLFAPVLGGVEVGDPAPDFELMGSDGNVYKLSQFRGEKPVVVAWFPKAFTGGWTIECKSLRDSGQELKNFDVVYFAASVDDAETNRKFAESLELNYVILSDSDKSVAKSFGVLNESGSYAVRWTYYIAKDGTIARIDRGVKPATSGADLVANLKDLSF